MILGLGSDLVRIERFMPWIDNPLATRFFHPGELIWCRSRKQGQAASLAARFAAKEAFGKALGSGLRGLKLSDIEVQREVGTAPRLVLHGTALAALERLGPARIHLSLSHEAEYAMATVILEGTGDMA